MNLKQYAGIGLIALGSVGATETVRRAIDHHGLAKTAYSQHLEAHLEAGELAFWKNEALRVLNRVEIEERFCNYIEETRGYDLGNLCVKLEDDHVFYRKKFNQLETEYESTKERSEKLYEEGQNNNMWYGLNIAGACFSFAFLAAGVGLALTSGRKKEKPEESKEQSIEESKQ